LPVYVCMYVCVCVCVNVCSCVEHTARGQARSDTSSCSWRSPAPHPQTAEYSGYIVTQICRDMQKYPDRGQLAANNSRASRAAIAALRSMQTGTRFRRRIPPSDGACSASRQRRPGNRPAPLIAPICRCCPRGHRMAGAQGPRSLRSILVWCLLFWTANETLPEHPHPPARRLSDCALAAGGRGRKQPRGQAARKAPMRSGRSAGAAELADSRRPDRRPGDPRRAPSPLLPESLPELDLLEAAPGSTPPRLPHPCDLITRCVGHHPSLRPRPARPILLHHPPPSARPSAPRSLSSSPPPSRHRRRRRPFAPPLPFARRRRLLASRPFPRSRARPGPSHSHSHNPKKLPPRLLARTPELSFASGVQSCSARPRPPPSTEPERKKKKEAKDKRVIIII